MPLESGGTEPRLEVNEDYKKDGSYNIFQEENQSGEKSVKANN